MESQKVNSTLRPTVTSSYGFGWHQMWKYFLHLFLISVVIMVATAPSGLIQEIDDYNSAGLIFLQIIGTAYIFLFLPVLTYGSDLLFLRAIRDEKIDLKELFIGFKNNYLNIILANLLTFAIIGIGFVFLIVPGIIFACRLAFVSRLVMDKGMEPVEAVEKSWQMTRGYGWKIFGIAVLSVPIFFGGIICFVFGVVIALIWIATAFGAIYHAVDLEEKSKLNGEEGEA